MGKPLMLLKWFRTQSRPGLFKRNEEALVGPVFWGVLFIYLFFKICFILSLIQMEGLDTLNST